MPLIYIIVLNYNTFEKTRICINSCLKQVYSDYKILLIDNASTDDSFSSLKKMYSDSIEYFQTGNNLGYAGGNNRGVDYCFERGAEYALLLNSDTELVGEHLLKEACEILERYPECAILAPTVYDVGKKGNILHTNDYPYNRWLKRAGVLPKNKVISPFIQTVSEAHGSALFVKCRDFMKVGGFPEHYFMYCEESTFAKKILWARHEIIWYKSSSNYVLHHHDKSGRVDSWRTMLMGRNRSLEYLENRKGKTIRWGLIYLLLLIRFKLFRRSSDDYYMYKGMRLGISQYCKHLSYKELYKEGVSIMNNYKL